MNPSSVPELSVCLITWNSLGKLSACLQALPAACGDLSHEVVLVDNGSSDNTVATVRERFPGVRMIKNPANRGVSRARNQALAAATGRVLIILDDDTIPTPDSLKRLAEVVKERPEIGIVGPRLEDPDGTLQLSCRKFHNGMTPFLRRLSFIGPIGRSRALRSYMLADWDHATERNVDHVIGACQVFSRATYDRLGALDERMFYGWEDTDYCVRAMRAGLKVLYYPECRVVHCERRLTRSRPLSRNTLEFIKSMLIFFTKYPGGLFGKY